MNNKLTISITYISNFNPNIYKNFNNFKNKNKNKIICRNLFLFLFLLKFLNNTNFIGNVKFFIKPKKKVFFNILKAPYKNKLSKHQIGFSRYYLNAKIIFNLKFIHFLNLKQFIYYNNKIIFFFNFFNTNVVSLHKFKFFYNFKLNNFFKLINVNF